MHLEHQRAPQDTGRDLRRQVVFHGAAKHDVDVEGVALVPYRQGRAGGAGEPPSDQEVFEQPRHPIP